MVVVSLQKIISNNLALNERYISVQAVKELTKVKHHNIAISMVLYILKIL